MSASRVTNLESIYTADGGAAFMTGIQALVRLPMMQRRLDHHHGLCTGGLVTGYRGSPLGAYDQQLWKAAPYLKAHDVVFQPGLNEDLAATALWGAQMHSAYGETSVDGVFGIWYGKGPGVDRSGDPFRAGNMLGTSALGGVLAVAGDDHAAQSSMYPHQTDGIFQSVMMPVIQPASVSEILSLGLAGLALSRFSGLWVAMKTIAEVVESAASFDLPEAYPTFLRPEHVVPPHGLNWDPHVAWPAQRAELERRLLDERLPAAIAWAGLNRLDRAVINHRDHRRLCVVTVGKAHQDLMQALHDLDLERADLGRLGVSVYKVAMSWPLDTASLVRFADRFDEILIVEEKQPIVEDQLKAALYRNPIERRPRVVGKTDQDGRPLLQATMELTPLIVARALLRRLAGSEIDAALAARLAVLEAQADDGKVVPFPPRKPFFCSGCPHNSSTKTPEGSISGGGIGCHVMALSQPLLKTKTFSQMGGEGAQWIGAAPFSKTPHIFQNLGDGTYQHSGLLAIRAAVAAGTAITYKILYNDAVAMTGGQAAEGAPTPAIISRQLAAEGVSAVHLVSDEPETWRAAIDLAPGTAIHHRDELDALQRQLREVPGVTAILYVQTCAAEKRRRRKRKAFPDPDRRLFINPRVCEGCGDCSVQSNCIAIEPLETAFGRKRQINQSSCNKDFSCVKGFCPSFVEIDGPVLRKPDGDRLKTIEAERFPSLPLPEIPALTEVANIYVAGIGGLGVLTLGALLGTAAHLEGLNATVLDFTGLAQKNGAVVSQIRIAPTGQPIHAVRIGAGSIDLMIATDATVAAAADGLLKLADGRSAIVLNTDETPTADVVTDRDATLPTERMVETLLGRADRCFPLRASSIARGLFGDTVAANVMMVGFAWQKGLLPLSLAVIDDGLEALGTAVAANKRAFAWGRFAAVDMAEVERIAEIAPPPVPVETTAALVARLELELVAYQDRGYADRYRALMDDVRTAARPFDSKGERFVRAVAENAYKLMAYKDEYEVARLYADPAFERALAAQFSDRRSMGVWLAPPFLSKTDGRTGRPAKRKFGPWVFTAFRLLAAGRFLRGGWADPFAHTAERRAERRCRDDYFEVINRICSDLSADRIETAIALASLPYGVRGFGAVKAASMQAAEAARAEMMSEWGCINSLSTDAAA